MTFEAQLVPGSQRYRVRTAEENERAFSRAARHSRAVAILRKVSARDRRADHRQLFHLDAPERHRRRRDGECQWSGGH